MLGLKGKAAVLFQRDAALAGGGAVLQEVAGVELDARLGGVHLHADAGLVAGRPGAEALAGTPGPVEDIAVVEAAARHGLHIDVGILANGALVFEATTGSLTDNLEAVYLDAVQRGVA